MELQSVIANIEALIADYELKHDHQLNTDDRYMVDHYAGALSALRKLKRLNMADKTEKEIVKRNTRKQKIMDSVL